MSSPDFASILDNTKELDRLRKEQEEVIIEINKMHKKLQATPEVVEKPGDNSLSRLRLLYTHARELSETEVNVSNLLISQLDALLPSGPPAQQRRRIAEGNEQKKKRMKTESDISRLSPSVRNQLEAAASLKGEQVAARVTPDDAEKDEWFVVKVMHFDRETREFEVLDEEPGDDEEGGGQRKYKLPMSHIIPFPKKNDPSSAPDYPPGRHVLAVYPGTTALYKATVVNPHRKQVILQLSSSNMHLVMVCGTVKLTAHCALCGGGVALQLFYKCQRKSDDYLLEFDDDEEDGSLPQRTVSFNKVVALPEGHRQ
ncbi:SAGA-associated factor 29 homolog A isoform X2 [Malania oleifera]|uniref:SAGA-associated factor 29 homolog A isoform X2 n=1 Tax=Malania oleifera TaxID=397392 RepID=UPI0025AE7399|nr:SAGA-associated factor 29 homolog A isoform X2 [Malania oleifera]